MTFSPFSKAMPTARNFSRNRLSRVMMSALFVIVAAGCSNNAADATNSNASVVNTAQAKTNTAPISSESNTAVVKALQANLKASGIEEKILSAVPTDMDDVYWVTAEGLPAFFTDKSGKHII